MQNFQIISIELISFLLTHLWHRLGRKKLLCLKDPLMQRHFGWLDDVYTDVKYVLTYRDPVETISSRLAVEKKLGKDKNVQLIEKLIKELIDYYEFANNLVITKPRRTLLINYQEIIDSSADQKLENFLEIDDIDRSVIWDSQFFSKGNRPSSAWMTPKYFQEITDKRTDIILTKTEIDLVNSRLLNTYNNLLSKK